MLDWTSRSTAIGKCSCDALITPHAHARARGYVIGRGVYIYIVSLDFFLDQSFISQNTHFQRSILTQIGFSSNLMASGIA